MSYIFYVVTYDISVDKRRKKVSDLLEGYGQRVQYSVFECFLNQAKFIELCSRMEKHIEISEDSIRFYPLSKSSLSCVKVWGDPPISKPRGSTVV